MYPARLFRDGSNGYESIELDSPKLAYPEDRIHHFVNCVLQGKKPLVTVEESLKVQQILEALVREDASFRGTAKAMFSRPGYEVPVDHELPRALAAALERAGGHSRVTGASFWTDAAVLGLADIPSILFGPGGAGLHSTEEYVNVADVVMCRDTLVELARQWGNPDRVIG